MRWLLALALASCTSNTLILVPQDAKGDVSIWFINDSQHDLCDLRMAPVTSPTPGYSWIFSAETMFPAGESAAARIRPGTYKVQTKSCDQKFEASNAQVDITGPTTIALGGSAGIKQIALQAKP